MRMPRIANLKIMRIVIISDIHDNLVNLEKCLDWCKENKIENIICCGDVTNGETLKFLSVNFFSDIYLVQGNVEIYDEDEIKEYGNIKYFGKVGRFELEGKFIGLCHELYLVEKVLKQGKCDTIFYGHTHRPWTSEKHDVKIVNPGTLGGMFEKATFAAWDTKSEKLELKLLDTL